MTRASCVLSLSRWAWMNMMTCLAISQFSRNWHVPRWLWFFLGHVWTWMFFFIFEVFFCFSDPYSLNYILRATGALDFALILHILNFLTYSFINCPLHSSAHLSIHLFIIIFIDSINRSINQSINQSINPSVSLCKRQLTWQYFSSHSSSDLCSVDNPEATCFCPNILTNLNHSKWVGY